MSSIGRSLLARRGRVLVVPGQKRLSGLSCLDLRKEIQDSARKNVRTKVIWETFVQEVCKRVRRYEDAPKGEQVDMFTPTDISLILSSFAAAKKRVSHFVNYILETTRSTINKYDLRDIAVLYNGLVKLGVESDDMINSFTSTIESKLCAKTSEKDIALILNALLELRIRDIKGVFIKSSLIISSRIKYISNCHTLTLLLHSYSRYKVSDGITPEGYGVKRIKTSAVVPDGIQQENYNESQFSPLHEAPRDLAASAASDERSPEVILLQETTFSLLGRCAELMMHMRPTDIMYYYRSACNLIYNNSDGVTQQLYASLANLQKAHIRIREHLLEFETRELIALLQTFGYMMQEAEKHAHSDNDGELWVVRNEIRNSIPTLKEELINELTYRSRVMSFADALAFLKLLDVKDNRGLLLYRRLTYTLNKVDNWEKYQKSQIWDLFHCLVKRCEYVTSTEAQELMVAVARNITGTLKLKEVDALLGLAAKLGSKTNALLKKAGSVQCRASCLLPSQAASMLYHLTGLGYIDHLIPLFDACLKIDCFDDALKVLVSMAILKVNGLIDPPETLVNVAKSLLGGGKERSRQDDVDNILAFIEAAGVYENRDGNRKYMVYPRIYGRGDCVTIENVDVSSANKLKLDCRMLSLEECIASIANSLKEFIAKFDERTVLHLGYDAGDMVIPIVLEFATGSKVAVHVLMNDFYSGKNRMLKIDVYTQLKLMQQRGFRTVCCLSQEYYNGDKIQFTAKLLERCATAASAEIAEESRDGVKNKEVRPKRHIHILQPKVDSFSRLRMLVTGDSSVMYNSC
ncbi:hypothetical protein BgAZ_106450 [Babesia gibsoni]|uniref:Uncharacterized protein n=1 Tax=Babesia gibsoni TaxID=33632 RepID=A0AAD8PG64_BABGI|nr:hypothetical protein BgAZ_106450 [Babesia gibsoni]